jgi:SPP1 gp7 family putative phage head morphogenesis protein
VNPIDPQGSSGQVLKYMRFLRAKLKAVASRVRAEAPQRISVTPGFLLNAAGYDFPVDATKYAAFMAWLREQLDAELFATESGVFLEDAYAVNQFIRLAHNTAGSRAKVKVQGPASILGGSDILLPFGPAATGVAQKSLATLYMRNFEALQGLSADTARAISQILGDGYVSGRSSLTIAREMQESINTLSVQRAERIARTEIVRAYAEGTLDMFESLGIGSVTARVEFATQGDNLVCPRCAVLGGRVFTVTEARGKIPVHPNCRCDWLPVVSESPLEL